MTQQITSKILHQTTLKNKISFYRQKGKTIVFTNGCFDILHWGHVSYLLSAKKNEQRVLIVGLNSDASVRMQEKGSERPIISQQQRALLLASLVCVDHVVIFKEKTPYELIKKIKPDVLVKGADWKGKDIAGADIVKSYGGRVEFIRYLKGLSTTNIISKIKLSV